MVDVFTAFEKPSSNRIGERKFEVQAEGRGTCFKHPQRLWLH